VLRRGTGASRDYPPKTLPGVREVLVPSAVLVAGLAGLATFLALEVMLRRLVRSARRSFQWLITEEDTLPVLDPEKLATFLAGSFSPELGWEPVPGTRGEDRAPGSVSTFSIDPTGARTAPPDGPAPTVAAFGDSYAFCRQVDDDQTWAAVLGQEAGVGVVNLGVGNYGVDQALLRYLDRRSELPETVSTVLAVFVPETILRIQSVWKHWMEFGNTFGFKPRFILEDGDLRLIPSPVRGAADYERLEEVVASIGDDPFWERRFRRLQFRPPYLATLLRAPVRHIAILATVLRGRGPDRVLGLQAFDRAFARVMRSNVREAHLAYRDREATALLSAILARFRAEVEADGRRLIVCVIPQMLDLTVPRRADRTYGAYFRRLGGTMEVVDLTDALRQHPVGELYVHDRYGGHLSVLGNTMVARGLAEVLR
jgi:hypothetical protein